MSWIPWLSGWEAGVSIIPSGGCLHFGENCLGWKPLPELGDNNRSQLWKHRGRICSIGASDKQRLNQAHAHACSLTWGWLIRPLGDWALDRFHQCLHICPRQRYPTVVSNTLQDIFGKEVLICPSVTFMIIHCETSPAALSCESWKNRVSQGEAETWSPSSSSREQWSPGEPGTLACGAGCARRPFDSGGTAGFVTFIFVFYVLYPLESPWQVTTASTMVTLIDAIVLNPDS